MATAKWVYLALLSTEIVFGLLSNFFVLAVVACNRKMRRSPMNLLIANLALADFLLLLYNAAYYSYSYPYVLHVPPNSLLVSARWVCALSQFLFDVCWAATINTFVVIALER